MKWPSCISAAKLTSLSLATDSALHSPHRQNPVTRCRDLFSMTACPPAYSSSAFNCAGSRLEGQAEDKCLSRRGSLMWSSFTVQTSPGTSAWSFIIFISAWLISLLWAQRAEEERIRSLSFPISGLHYLQEVRQTCKLQAFFLKKDCILPIYFYYTGA